MMEVNTDLNIESKPVLLPEANKWILILVFLLGDSNTLILMKVSTGDILPPHSPLLDLITQWQVMLLVQSVIQLSENQSHSLDFILAGQ